MNTKQSIQYYILKYFFAFLGILPWCIISFLSYIFYLICRIIGYRKSVILSNLRGVFPEKNNAEINSILLDFYKNFTYQIVSSPKLLYQTPETIKSKHFFLTGMEILDKLKQDGHKVIFILMGHYGNWELFSSGQIYMKELGLQQEQIYRPQKNKAIDEVLKELRGRFGSISLAKDKAPSKIISALRSKDNICHVFDFIADQSPSSANVHYFTKFLSRETAFLSGVERLAKRFNIPVVYIDVVYIKKGSYNCTIELLSDNPKSLEDMELTEMYAKSMQKTILRNPSHWLWSHKRWKIDPKLYPDVLRSKDLLN